MIQENIFVANITKTKQINVLLTNNNSFQTESMSTPPGPELKNIMAKTELVMEVGFKFLMERLEGIGNSYEKLSEKEIILESLERIVDILKNIKAELFVIEMGFKFLWKVQREL